MDCFESNVTSQVNCNNCNHFQCQCQQHFHNKLSDAFADEVHFFDFNDNDANDLKATFFQQSFVTSTACSTNEAAAASASSGGAGNGGVDPDENHNCQFNCNQTKPKCHFNNNENNPFLLTPADYRLRHSHLIFKNRLAPLLEMYESDDDYRLALSLNKTSPSWVADFSSSSSSGNNDNASMINYPHWHQFD